MNGLVHLCIVYSDLYNVNANLHVVCLPIGDKRKMITELFFAQHMFLFWSPKLVFEIPYNAYRCATTSWHLGIYIDNYSTAERAKM